MYGLRDVLITVRLLDGNEGRGETMRELNTRKQLILRLFTMVLQCLIGAFIIIVNEIDDRIIGVVVILCAAMLVLLLMAIATALDLFKHDLRTVTGKVVKYKAGRLLVEDINGNTYKLKIFRGHINEILENHTFKVEYYRRTKAVNRFMELS